MPASDPDFIPGSRDRTVRPQASGLTRTVVTPPSPMRWMPTVAEAAPRFNLVDVAALPPGADPALRATRELMRLIEEGKVTATNDFGVLRVDPQQVKLQLEGLGYRLVRELDPAWVPPGTPPPGPDPNRVYQLHRDAMPVVPHPGRGQYREKTAAMEPPPHDRPGHCGGLLGSGGSFQAGPGAPSIDGGFDE